MPAQGHAQAAVLGRALLTALCKSHRLGSACCDCPWHHWEAPKQHMARGTARCMQHVDAPTLFSTGPLVAVKRSWDTASSSSCPFALQLSCAGAAPAVSRLQGCGLQDREVPALSSRPPTRPASAPQAGVHRAKWQQTESAPTAAQEWWVLLLCRRSGPELAQQQCCAGRCLVWPLFLVLACGCSSAVQGC